MEKYTAVHQSKWDERRKDTSAASQITILFHLSRFRIFLNFHCGLSEESEQIYINFLRRGKKTVTKMIGKPNHVSYTFLCRLSANFHQLY